VKLLEVGEGREVGMMLGEVFCFGEVGVVMKDGDVGGRAIIS
jgi:hypothetical protein